MARARERKVSSIRLVGVPGTFAKVARETQRDGVVSGLVAAAVSARYRCCPSIDRAATNPDTIHVANSHIWSTAALIDVTTSAREYSCAVVRDFYARAVPVSCHAYNR